MNYGNFSNPKGGYDNGKPKAVNTYQFTPSDEKTPPKRNCSIIFFVNGHWSELLPGPYDGGIAYWQYFNSAKDEFSAFLSRAVSYFNIKSQLDFKFVDGSSWIAIDSSGQERKDDGYDFAKSNFEGYLEIMLTNKIYFVSHSEGGAFATGMAKYFVENGVPVIESVLLACDEGDEFEIDFKIDCYQIELMYWSQPFHQLKNYSPGFDWVINTKLKDGGVKGVKKFGVAISKHANSQTVHAAYVVDKSIFGKLEQLKKVQVTENKNPEGHSFFTQSNAQIKFYQVDKHIIGPNHPNWDNLTGKIKFE